MALREHRRPGLAQQIAVRVALGAAMLLLVSVIVFLGTQLLPGDVARQLLGQNATAQQLASLRESLGLDRPAIVQYLHWLGGLVTGNLGTSLTSGTPVVELIAIRVQNSALVVLLAAVIVLPLGVILGSLAARRPGGVIDHVVSWVVHVILSLPEFVVAILLVVVFASGWLHLLPPTSPLDPQESAWSQGNLLVLPVLAMVLISLPHLTEAIKVLVRAELASDHVRWARLSGIPSARVLGRYALPGVVGPGAQVAAVTVNYLLGGTVAVETVFSFPGIGSELVAAVANRDIVVVQVIAMGIAVVLLVAFLLADIAGLLTDPRRKIGAL